MHGLTGTNRERPGLREALAACRAGDTLVVTKPDRLARPPPDARAIADELTTRQISLSLGGSVYDPTDAVGRLQGKQPKPNRCQEAHLVSLVHSGEYSTAEIAAEAPSRRRLAARFRVPAQGTWLLILFAH